MSKNTYLLHQNLDVKKLVRKDQIVQAESEKSDFKLTKLEKSELNRIEPKKSKVQTDQARK